MKRATILAPLLSCLLLSEAGAAGWGSRRFEKGEFAVGADSRYFFTDSNYTSSGGQQSLPSSGTYQHIDVDLEGRFILTNSWALSAGMDIGNAESNGADALRSNSSLTGAFLGVEWNWATEYIDLIPTLEVSFPFEKISSTQDAVMNSEGVSENRLLLRFQSEFEGFNLFGMLGHVQRGGGRSTLMPWSAGVEFMTTSFRFGGVVHGFQSTSDDADAGSSDGELARTTTSNRVNGGSLRYYAINPSLVDLDGFVVFELGRPWALTLHGGLTLAGQNTAAGYHGGAGLSYTFNTKPVRRRRPYDSQISVDPYVDQFREDVNDGVDQDIFRSRPKPIVQPKPRRERTPVPSTDMDTQQKLDETEMLIELKVDGRKKRRK